MLNPQEQVEKAQQENGLGQPVLDPRRHLVLAMLSVVMVFNMLDRQIITILLEPIKQEFNASDKAMGLLVGFVFAGFYAAASFPLARWADRGKRSLVMACCLGFWSLMTALGGVAQNFIQLALTRIGVAVGEAGSGPASQSMIADLYPLGSRATALAVLLGFNSIGIGMGVLLGGWLSDTFSWRMAFFLVGVPGIVLAVIIYFFLPEPKRGGADGKIDTAVQPKFLDVYRHLIRIPTYRCIVLIAAFVAICGYGTLMWGPTFFRRVHGLSGTEVGIGFGLATAASLFIGNVGAGIVSDWAAKKDLRWYMWIAGIGPALGFPCGLLFVFGPNATVSFIGMFLFQCLITFHIPPVYTMGQTLAPLRMRAMAMVNVSFLQTLVGIGLAPFIIGSVNDALMPQMGDEAIRYSLALVMLAALAAAITAFFAALWIRKDYAESQQTDDAQGYGTLAWGFATAAHRLDRDGKRAVVFAEKLIAVRDDAHGRNVLAAALAEAGRFEDAVSAQELALAKLGDEGLGELASDYDGRLKLYQQNQPYRQ